MEHRGIIMTFSQELPFYYKKNYMLTKFNWSYRETGSQLNNTRNWAGNTPFTE